MAVQLIRKCLKEEAEESEFIILRHMYDEFVTFKDIDRESGNIRDLLDKLVNSGTPYDQYKHKSDKGLTIFYDTIREEIPQEEKSRSSHVIKKPVSLPKSTSVRLVKKKYSDYSGEGYVLRSSDGKYKGPQGRAFLPQNDPEVRIFFDRSAAQKSSEYGSYENWEIIPVKVSNGEVRF